MRSKDPGGERPCRLCEITLCSASQSGVGPVADPHKPRGAALGPLDSHGRGGGDRSPQKESLCGNVPPGTLSVHAPSPHPLGVSQVPVCQSLSVERTLSTKPLACMGEHMVSAPQQLLADDKRHVRSFLCTPDVQDGAIRQGSAASRAPCLCPWVLLSRHGKGTVPTSERLFRGTSSSCVF